MNSLSLSTLLLPPAEASQHEQQKAVEKIENLVNAQQLLLANASHELRTPLSRIRLGVEMLGKHDDQARRKMLKNDIIELDALIHELMLMTRLDSGKK